MESQYVQYSLLDDLMEQMFVAGYEACVRTHDLYGEDGVYCLPDGTMLRRDEEDFDAIQVGETEAVHVGQAPEDSQAVDQDVRQQGTTQEEEEVI